MKRNRRSARATCFPLNIKKPVWIAIAVGILVLAAILAGIFLIPKEEPEAAVTPVPSPTPSAQVTPTPSPTDIPVAETPVPTATPEPTPTPMLEHLVEYYEKNPDIAGWIRIDDTVIDYPVMYTPEDGEKYIYKNFEGRFSAAGLPFIEDDCSMDPESDNLIIYAHNMNNGSMFGTLMQYSKEKYYQEHPTVRFSTLYEEREYEIISAFYDRVYYKTEDCFKFYQFIDAESEEAFREAMDYYKEHGLYDTGVQAEYGDRLITLVTCAYHIENGRFVVVAREKQ